jgi:Ca2+/H+ antiporter
MFFVGVAVTLAIVLIVLFVIQIIYKRRRHASKLSTSGLAVDRVEMQTKTSPEEARNNQINVSKFSAGTLLAHN